MAYTAYMKGIKANFVWRNRMIKNIISLSWALITFCITTLNVNAQAPELLLGLPYNSQEVTQLVSSFNNKKPTESFLPFQQIYKQDYFEDGIAMEFNSDISLYRIKLYDSGYTYQAYKKSLPKDVSWGMNLDQVQKKTGLLEFEPTNQYIGILPIQDYVIQFYFENGRLYHIVCTASMPLLERKIDELIAGTGLRLLPNGTPTEGNVIDGIGTMRWGKAAAMYKGEWAYGLPHGKGQYIDSLGNQYEGEFKLGFFWGEGIYKSKSEKYIYSGTHVMSKRHFIGKIVYGDKNAYEGVWVQDKMQGEGKYYVGVNYLYEGTMKNNAFNGKGILTTPDGTISGSFKNGKPHGYCEQKSTDGQQWAKGNFTNGKKNGTFTISSNGNEREANYEDDIEINIKTK